MLDIVDKIKLPVSVLSDADDADLTNRFSQVEQERNLTGMHERVDAEVARWESEQGR